MSRPRARRPAVEPAPPDARQQLAELARQRPDGVLSLWLLYEEDHDETISGDGFGLTLDFASPQRDEVHEIARGRAAATRWYVFHIDRVDLRLGPAGGLEVREQLDTTVPGEQSYHHDVTPSADELVRALACPRQVESGAAWPPADPPAERPTPDPGLGRPFEMPAGVIDGALAMIERDLGYVLREFARSFERSPIDVAPFTQVCEAWRAAVVTHGVPAAERLRARLAAGQNPAPALRDFDPLAAAARTFDERLRTLLSTPPGEASAGDFERLAVLLTESSTNHLRGWLRIEREREEITRLWNERSESRVN